MLAPLASFVLSYSSGSPSLLAPLDSVPAVASSEPAVPDYASPLVGIVNKMGGEGIAGMLMPGLLTTAAKALPNRSQASFNANADSASK